jgi:chorismate dehydratase
MSISLGRIPYLNSEVFYQDFPLDLVELHDYVPSALSRAARRGEVDVGPVPTVTFFELEDQFMPLGDFGIAVEDKARSVLFFSRRPIEELDGSRIGITGESSTSVRLLKILMHQRYGVWPSEYVSTTDTRTDGILLIGDAALNNRHGLPSYPRVYDLGEMWREWTGLPFVFALWIVRRDLNREATELLVKLIDKSLERGMGRIDEIAAKRSDLSMTPGEVREYLLGFNYRLGDREKEAIALFRKHLDAEERATGTAGDQASGTTGEDRLREAPNAG